MLSRACAGTCSDEPYSIVLGLGLPSICGLNFQPRGLRDLSWVVGLMAISLVLFCEVRGEGWFWPILEPWCSFCREKRKGWI